MKTQWCLLVCGMMVMANQTPEPAANQLVEFKNSTTGPIGIISTAFGSPVNQDDANVSLNKRLIFHKYFMDSLTHLVRERIPARVVHAKGGGAFGYFEVTHDITHICKAKLFSEVGKRTPVAVRFSPIVQEVGGIDTGRDARGFAIKFYTEDGNFDIAGLNTPVFVTRDPLFFHTFVHTRKRNPQTYSSDANMYWDFLVLRPESLHVHLRILFSDLGIPDGYRHMPGFSVHTFQVVNEQGESYFVRFHFRPNAGVKNLSTSEATRLAGVNPDYANRDLYNAIHNGNYPSWTVSIQVLSVNDVKNATMDVFDITKMLPEDQYPLRPLGRFVLNRNPVNYFSEIEQIAFCPANLVPGILGAPDKIFEARRLSYIDAQFYRLGSNFENIPVNRPLRQIFTYNRDGRAPVWDTQSNSPNYHPNSYYGPVPYIEENNVELVEIRESPPDNFDQIRDMYNEMTLDERDRLIERVVASLGMVTDKSLVDRSVALLKQIDSDIGNRVSEGMQANGNMEEE